MTTEIKLEQNPQSATSSAEEKEQFQWTKQWYPVAVTEFLDPSRPHAIQLLGKDLVLWRDQQGQWNCFADQCPHRLAPLSEGRVEADGTLLCAYHAWRFNSEGKCVRIPQSKDAETEAENCANPKACAIAYPTQERQGLLWVWPESGAVAQLESQTRSPRLIPELENPSERVVKLFWNIRDLPYGWDFFMENVSDPAHVPVSHHGLVGDRYRDAKYYDMNRVREISTQEGFAFDISPTAPTIQQALHDFQPPCLMKITTSFKDGGKLILVLYAVPTRPGWCRHIGCQILVKNDAGKAPGGLAFFALPMPTWVGHILASLFLHQDLVFLHYQEKILAKHSKGRWLDAVYTPNPQDKMIITFRQWLEKRAGGEIPWDIDCHPELPSAEIDKRNLFDVWTTHTQHCQACQKALKTNQRLVKILYIGAVVCLLLGVILDVRHVAALVATVPINSSLLTTIPTWEVWLALVGAIAFGTGGYLLQKFNRLFYVYEFSHSHND